MASFAPTHRYVKWPDERLGPWRIGLHWELVNGQVECVGVDVHSFIQEVRDGKLTTRPLRRGAHPQAIDTGVLRSIPLSTLISRERVKMAGWVEGLQGHPHLSEKSRAEIEKQFPHWRVEGGAPSGRKGYPIAHFQEVAAIYKAADGHKPTTAVKNHWTSEKGWPITKSTATKWVARARELGLLPPAPGKGIATRTKRDER